MKQGLELPPVVVDDVLSLSSSALLELGQWRTHVALAGFVCRASWQATSYVLDAMLLATSRFLTALVLDHARPDLWRPWAELFQLGAPVVGFTSASSFHILDCDFLPRADPHVGTN